MPMVINPLTTQPFWPPCSGSKACDVTVSWRASALLIGCGILVSTVINTASILPIHCVVLCYENRQWSRINTTSINNKIKFVMFNHITIGKAIEAMEKLIWNMMGFFLRNTRISQLILAGKWMHNLCKNNVLYGIWCEILHTCISS